METETGSSISSANIADYNKLQTKVFNSDYIERNLFFKETGASNILVLTDKAQEVMNELEELNREIKNIKRILTNQDVS